MDKYNPYNEETQDDVEVLEIFEDSEEKVLREQRLEELNPDYIIDTLKDHLQFPLEDNVDYEYLRGVLKTAKNLTEQDDIDETGITESIDAMYEEMTSMIEDRFGFDFYKDGVSSKKILKNLYRFFVIELTQNISQFIVEYLTTNCEEISQQLTYLKGNVSAMAAGAQDYDIPEGIIMAMGNLSEVVQLIKQNTELSLSDFVSYIEGHEDSSPAVEKIESFIQDMRFGDDRELFDTLIDMIIEEEPGFANVYTSVREDLYNRYVVDDEE